MRKIFGICFFAAVLLSPIPAQAITVIDQEHAPDGNFGARAIGVETNDLYREQIQTFTVGVSGQLTSIEVKMGRGYATVDPLELSLWTTDLTGLPDQLLTSAMINPIDVSAGPRSFVAFDLSTDAVDVFAGSLLAIVLLSDAPNTSPFVKRYNWENGGDYSGGDAYTRIGDFLIPLSTDFHFRSVVAVVPLPAGMFLFLTGIAALGIGRRFLVFQSK